MNATPTHETDFGTGEKKLRVYVIGMILCVLLTIIPFAAVMRPEVSDALTLVIVFISAILQFFVQLICFLRLNYSTPQAKMNVMSFVFAAVILFVLIIGSLWIMFSLNYNMVH